MADISGAEALALAKAITAEHRLSLEDELLFLIAVNELGGLGDKEDWEETQGRLAKNPRVQAAFQAFEEKISN